MRIIPPLKLILDYRSFTNLLTCTFALTVIIHKPQQNALPVIIPSVPLLLHRLPSSPRSILPSAPVQIARPPLK